MRFKRENVTVVWNAVFRIKEVVQEEERVVLVEIIPAVIQAGIQLTVLIVQHREEVTIMILPRQELMDITVTIVAVEEVWV